MTRPFFTKDRISHFDIFDRCVSRFDVDIVIVMAVNNCGSCHWLPEHSVIMPLVMTLTLGPLVYSPCCIFVVHISYISY